MSSILTACHIDRQLDFTLKSQNKDNNLCLTKTPSNCILGNNKATGFSVDIIIFIHNLVPSLFQFGLISASSI